MRREHDSIFVEVLDAINGMQDKPFQVTVLAARANLPHDRLRTYLDELSVHGLIEAIPNPSVTTKGQQFLECYHAWVRIQKLYGLDPRAGRGQALRLLPGGMPLHLLPTTPSAPDVAKDAVAPPAAAIGPAALEEDQSLAPVATRARALEGPGRSS